MLVFQRERLYVVLNKLEKSGDFHAMIREKFCFHTSAGLGIVQVNADKASCNASFLLSTSSDQAKGTWSRTQY